MAADRRMAEFFRDQLTELGEVQIKRMFSGWGLVLHGEFLGAVLGDVFYLKVDPYAFDRMSVEGGHAFAYTRKDGRGSLSRNGALFPTPTSTMHTASPSTCVA